MFKKLVLFGICILTLVFAADSSGGDSAVVPVSLSSNKVVDVPQPDSEKAKQIIALASQKYPGIFSLMFGGPPANDIEAGLNDFECVEAPQNGKDVICINEEELNAKIKEKERRAELEKQKMEARRTTTMILLPGEGFLNDDDSKDAASHDKNTSKNPLDNFDETLKEEWKELKSEVSSLADTALKTIGNTAGNIMDFIIGSDSDDDA